MRAVVVYESMYGNTHAIADAIGDGLRRCAEVDVVPVHDADAALEAGADVIVVGGPTHAHGMARASTRKAALDAVEKPESGLTLDAEARGPGLREWLASLGHLDVPAATFDTRIDGPAPLTGRASKGIARALHRRGCPLVSVPESFLVTKQSHLEPGEEDRARIWGASLAARLVPEREAGHA